VELGRKLAERGHTVLHVYSASFLAPRGEIGPSERDTSTFTTMGISLSQPVQKDSFVKRWLQDREYGNLAAKEVEKFKPEVVICANSPLEIVSLIQKASDAVGAKFVFWCQDINGIAVKAILGKKIPVVGSLIGDYAIRMEARLLRQSDAVVVISEDFKSVFQSMGVGDLKTHVLPNWAPLDQLPLKPRHNPWSAKNGLDDKFVFLYSGTLGFKHNPNLLLRLAESFESNPGVIVQVVSEGTAVEWLKGEVQSRKLSRLKILPFQPFAELPEVFASADVLTAILEPSAAEFSVPSKVLAYLCAQKALLLAVPKNNLISRIVLDNQAGLVAPPDDEAAFVEAAQKLYADPEMRKAKSLAGRAYAEKTFKIDSICEAFEEILTEALA
jgi:colanic acid biosynthesis glycosyl transferase WcaI